MPVGSSRWTDERIEQVMGNLLRGGVITAGLVVCAGALPYMVHYGKLSPHVHVFHGEPAKYRSVPAILADVYQRDSRGIIQFGLLLLIATPIARVVFSAFAFARQRDWLYLGVTLFVMAILIWSLAGTHP
jgi:uncharacterized membrane protein